MSIWPTAEMNHAGPTDNIPTHSVSVVKRFIWSGIFFVILNIWLILQALKDGFFKSSCKVDYSPVSREDSFTRGCARESYRTAIYNGYRKKKSRLGSGRSSKTSTSEYYDSGYSANLRSDSWTDTSASEKRLSDGSFQTSFWLKNELDKPLPLRSNYSTNTKVLNSDGTTSDMDDDDDDDDVYFVPRKPRNSDKRNYWLHSERDVALDVLKPITVIPPNQRSLQENLSGACCREIHIDALHIHATSISMGIESVRNLFSNPGPIPHQCMVVRQDIGISDEVVYDAQMDWV